MSSSVDEMDSVGLQMRWTVYGVHCLSIDQMDSLRCSRRLSISSTLRLSVDTIYSVGLHEIDNLRLDHLLTPSDTMTPCLHLHTLVSASLNHNMHVHQDMHLHPSMSSASMYAICIHICHRGWHEEE